MGLDSVELVMEWEKYFNIEIPDNEASKMTTVKDAVDYVSMQVEYINSARDVKEIVSAQLKTSFLTVNANYSITSDDKIFDLIPYRDIEKWKIVSQETTFDMPDPLLRGSFGRFIDRIFPQKDNIGDTTFSRFIDLVAAVNYEKVIDRNSIKNKYETMIAIIGITIEKIGVSPFEIFENSCFTKDLGVD